MTDPISELLKICEAATPGPWVVGYADGSGKYRDDTSVGEYEVFCLADHKDDTVFHARMSENKADSDFIATFNPAKVQELLKNIQSLEARVEFLSCLEEAGVDNWAGYEEAQQIYKEYKEAERTANASHRL